jgi:hypothetical protein
MVKRKPWQQFPSAEEVVDIYARLRKRVSRRDKTVIVVEEAEEDDKCECNLCLRSESMPSNRDIFAESKKLAELLNTLPQPQAQVDGFASGSSTSPRTNLAESRNRT